MQNQFNAPRLLYFTASAAITEEERDAAFAITHNVGFRNGSIKAADRLETCDAVAGSPPLAYREVYFVVSTTRQLEKAAKDRAAGRSPDMPDDATEDEPPELIEPDMEGKSDEYKSGFAAGKLKTDYGDAAKVTDDFKAGYAAGLPFADKDKATEVVKKTAKANKPKPPPTPPVWGAKQS